MWLLRTSTGELHHFDSPYDVKGGYAILSHVWQKHEQTFQELQALRSQLASIGRKNLLSRVSEKIRESCILARTHGYDWLWIDTCCIDRSSSAELSEAINSMYDWYAGAQVCYAYLYDVPDTHGLHSLGSQFRKSRWFTRGWTLQELIAPRSLLFVSQNWTVLGTKGSLAPLLEEITGVDADVLTFRQDLGNISVARRMSWAANRKTTRLEDEAYSLMGIFGVHMATIYGEGRRAFRRLQEEILKRTSDQTLFAWGNVLPIRTAPFRERMAFGAYHSDCHMFATSPAAFSHSGSMVPVAMEVAVHNALRALGIKKRCTSMDVAPAGPQAGVPPGNDLWRIPLPDFMVTTHGVRSRVLVIESSTSQSSLAIAVLACEDTSTGSFVGLLLRRRIDGQAAHQFPRYHVGVTIRGMHPWMRLRYRLSQVDWARHALSFSSSGISVRWEQLYISHRPPSRSPPPRAAEDGAAFRFFFPRWFEVELRKQGFRPDAKLPVRRAEAPKLSAKGSMATYTFTHQQSRDAFRIYVGNCHGAPWSTATFVGAGKDTSLGSPRPASELKMVPRIPPAPSTRENIPTCDCRSAALTSWPNGSRTFGDARRNVQLTFTRANGGGTHLLDVRVGGSAYHPTTRQMGRRLVHIFVRPRPPFLL